MFLPCQVQVRSTYFCMFGYSAYCILVPSCREEPMLYIFCLSKLALEGSSVVLDVAYLAKEES